MISDMYPISKLDPYFKNIKVRSKMMTNNKYKQTFLIMLKIYLKTTTQT